MSVVSLLPSDTGGGFRRISAGIASQRRFLQYEAIVPSTPTTREQQTNRKPASPLNLNDLDEQAACPSGIDDGVTDLN